MLIKTDSYKKNDLLMWNIPYLQKTSKPEELRSFIIEHGSGPFYVAMDYTVYCNNEQTRWINIKSVNNDKVDLTKVDEICFVQVILANPHE